MKVLKMNFTTQEGKIVSLTLKNVAQDLTSQVVLSQMQQIAQAQLCQKDGVDLYHQPATAEYVETIETPLF